MKYTKLFLLVVPVLASCAAPAASAPPTQTFTQEPTPSISIADVSSTAPIPVTIDPAMGSIEGTISWADSLKSTGEPLSNVNIELNGHSSSTPRYKIKNDLSGHYEFVNIEPINYGVGVYFNLPINQRRCEDPEFIYGQDLGWLHYATALRRDIWYDVIFSSNDLMVNPGETVVMDFVLKCASVSSYHHSTPPKPENNFLPSPKHPCAVNLSSFRSQILLNPKEITKR